MSDARYWIWMQCALGEGTLCKPILEEFGSAKGLFDANIMEWRMSSSLTARQVLRLEQTPLSTADEILYTCAQNSWQVLPFDHPAYPERLRQIINPPLVLYVDGELPDTDHMVTIGMVGTRQASEYAMRVCDIMAKGAAQGGAVVVSGGALGIDSAAHKGAMLAGGKTIAVLGCGLGTKYLMRNKPLRDEIRCHGALVTEFPPFTAAAKHTFPLRNRIISGLSLGVLVVEASVKSGSLITARCALEQGRDVFAVPGSVLSSDFAGTNRLIHDGAYVVTQPVQLLSNYAEQYGLDLNRVQSVEALMQACTDCGANLPEEKDKYSFEHLEEGRTKRQERENNLGILSDAETMVFDALEDVFTHVDNIAERCTLSQGQLLASLTKLELLDLAESASGSRFRKK